MRIGVRCAWIGWTLGLGGCVATPPVPINVDVVPEAKVRFQVSPHCGWTLHAVVDARDYQHHVGPSMRRLDTTRMAELVQQGMATLGITAHTRVDPPRPLTVSILQAYVDGIGLVKDGALVLRVTGADGLKFTVRGVDRTSNWAGGDTEIQRTVSRMLDDALQRTYTALLQHCAR